MALFSFLKTPKPNHYDYKPRFWDPKKEEREKRLKYLNTLKESNVEDVKSRLSGSFKKGIGSNPNVRKKAVFRSNMILITTIIVLLLLSYVILYVNLPGILNFLE